ncbi:MAG TPA: tRNA pseudouridine(13) synthase TruD, partial [Myxococcaceae bacterium]
DQPRVERGEIVATGPIFGWKMQRPEGEVDAAEQAVLAAEGLTLDSFRRLGGIAEGTRRPFAVAVTDAQWSVEGATVELSFMLPAGSYATVLLDEVIKESTSGASPDH